MYPPGPVEILHLLLSAYLHEGDSAIDATSGNGYDTVFLANCVGESGKVIAIDLQENAIKATRQRCEAASHHNSVSYYQMCHSKLAQIATPSPVAAAIFNLGYLPKADHKFTTSAETTIAGLSAAYAQLKIGGILAVVCYTGHPGGPEESAAVEEYFEKLPGHHTTRYGVHQPQKPAPFLLTTAKRKKL